MNFRYYFLLVAAAALLFSKAGGVARGETLTFDDLPQPTSPDTVIPNGYGGLTWSNFYYLNASLLTLESGPNGYGNGLVSTPNVAYNGFGNEAVTSGNPFTFNSAYFTGAWNNGLNVVVTGLSNGVQVDQTSFTVDSTSPTLKTFNWTNVDQLVFDSSGGTHAGYVDYGTQFAMDDFTFTPGGSVGVPDARPFLMVLLGGALLVKKLFRSSI